MNDVALRTDHDVSVMSIFDLEQVTEEAKGMEFFFWRCLSIRKRFSKICKTYSPDDAVCRHGKHKVFPRLLIFDAGLIAEQLLEINGQSDIRLSAELVAGFAIRNAFDHSATAIQMKRPENDMT